MAADKLNGINNLKREGIRFPDADGFLSAFFGQGPSTVLLPWLFVFRLSVASIFYSCVTNDPQAWWLKTAVIIWRKHLYLMI